MVGTDLTMDKILKCHSDPEPFELMVHPGYCANPATGGFPPNGPDDFSRDSSREFELNFLRKQNELEII